MQTTLRIDDQLYRAAKAEAAREGVTLTRFLEEGLRLRLRQASAETAPTPSFRVYEPRTACLLSDQEIQRIAAESQEEHDMAKLGSIPSYRP
jgi:hypothetical protein